MAVKLRLTRGGSKKKPTYRIVAIDSHTKRDGQYIELVGTYNPTKSELKINEEVALKWLGLGAIPSDTVKNLLSKEGIVKKFADSKKKVSVKETKEETKKETKKPAAKKATTKKAK